MERPTDGPAPLSTAHCLLTKRSDLFLELPVSLEDDWVLPMKISGYSYSFGGILERVAVDHPKVIRFYSEMHVRGIEIFDPYLRSDDEIPAIIDALGETEMSVSMYDILCNVVSRDASIRSSGTNKFHERLQAAKKLGAAQVLILPGYPSGDIKSEECHEWLNEAIQKSLPVADDLGITLTIANLGYGAATYGSSDYILATCEASDNRVKATYDVGNFLMANEDPIEALDKVFPHVVHVHFKDWEILPSKSDGAWTGIDGRLYSGKALGEGIVDLPAAVDRLKELNYDGYISPEYEGIKDPWQAIDTGIGYLRTLL